MGMQGPPPSVDPTKYCVDVRDYGCVVVIVATFDYSALSEQFSRPYQNGLPMGRCTICHMTGACSGYIPRVRSLPGSSLQVPALRTDSLERPRRRNKAHVSDPNQWRAAVHDAGAHVSPLPDDEATESLQRTMENLQSEPVNTDIWLNDLVESIEALYQLANVEDAQTTTRDGITQSIQSAEELQHLSAASASAAGRFISITAAGAIQLRQQGINASGAVLIIYVNGINTTFPKAINSLFSLKDAMDEVSVSYDDLRLFVTLQPRAMNQAVSGGSWPVVR